MARLIKHLIYSEDGRKLKNLGKVLEKYKLKLKDYLNVKKGKVSNGKVFDK